MGYADQIAPAVQPLPFSLMAWSAIAGVAMILLFRALSRPAAIRAARRRMQARLLELRLFGDEPVLVWRAQTGLLYANLRYLRAMAPPILLIALPMALAWPHLDAVYGRAPLPVGAVTMITVELREPITPKTPPPVIVPPPGLHVETPAVRVFPREISWELRAAGPVSQPVRIDFGHAAVSKMVRVGNGGTYLAEVATASPLAWLLNPGEPVINASPAASVRVIYGAARWSFAGLMLPWEVWFLAVSMIAALAGKFYWKVAL